MDFKVNANLQICKILFLFFDLRIDEYNVSQINVF